MDTKAKKRKQLRNNEYYDMQEVFDQLYANAGNNAKYTHLMQIVMSAENIKLAYRNIKKNKGSDTRGTDGKTIRDYESMNEEEMIAYFQSKMMNYNPKSVRRVEIPKPMAQGTDVFSRTTFIMESRSVVISLRVPVTPRLETI